MDVYCDGATTKNGYEGAKGGWAYIIVENDQLYLSDHGFIDGATNNICELMAMIKGVAAANVFNCNVNVYSDSAYIINCYKDQWYKKWQTNGWVNSKKESVANKELWQQLIPFFENKRFKFEKVKAHSGDKWNGLVDEMAVEAKNG